MFRRVRTVVGYALLASVGLVGCSDWIIVDPSWLAVYVMSPVDGLETTATQIDIVVSANDPVTECGLLRLVDGTEPLFVGVYTGPSPVGAPFTAFGGAPLALTSDRTENTFVIECEGTDFEGLSRDSVSVTRIQD